jgi:hypothetical protein
MGFEPTTPCLQSRCSSQTELRPQPGPLTRCEPRRSVVTRIEHPKFVARHQPVANDRSGNRQVPRSCDWWERGEGHGWERGEGGGWRCRGCRRRWRCRRRFGCVRFGCVRFAGRVSWCERRRDRRRSSSAAVPVRPALCSRVGLARLAHRTRVRRVFRLVRRGSPGQFDPKLRGRVGDGALDGCGQLTSHGEASEHDDACRDGEAGEEDRAKGDPEPARSRGALAGQDFCDGRWVLMQGTGTLLEHRGQVRVRFGDRLAAVVGDEEAHEVGQVLQRVAGRQAAMIEDGFDRLVVEDVVSRAPSAERVPHVAAPSRWRSAVSPRRWRALIDPGRRDRARATSSMERSPSTRRVITSRCSGVRVASKRAISTRSSRMIASCSASPPRTASATASPSSLVWGRTLRRRRSSMTRW